ncbi:hypothetical protein [Halorubrum ezzemoulense]|uniref:hypothetical protein n=1 Tax=Halorubrum ezzemoulense TaxID=337243 RepID=UPI00232B1A8A|nr:hypothetical protein [Halorubrum ezzemoulense]MDB9253345.1 hypothetical protein [Halorubrum ezzemoulense]MDB9256290.1 hypothetical protein [Halorubrum ezzemoulense]MDB9277662.1 hypothetical protein [Halorubrum ezzemoulense]
MYIFATGETRFIDGHLAKSYLEDEQDVTVLKNFEAFYGECGIQRRFGRLQAAPT